MALIRHSAAHRGNSAGKGIMQKPRRMPGSLNIGTERGECRNGVNAAGTG